MASQNGCHFFDSATVVKTSPIDGVHLDPTSHQLLGDAVYKEVRGFFGDTLYLANQEHQRTRPPSQSQKPVSVQICEQQSPPLLVHANSILSEVTRP